MRRGLELYFFIVNSFIIERHNCLRFGINTQNRIWYAKARSSFLWIFFVVSLLSLNITVWNNKKNIRPTLIDAIKLTMTGKPYIDLFISFKHSITSKYKSLKMKALIVDIINWVC